MGWLSALIHITRSAMAKSMAKVQLAKKLMTCLWVTRSIRKPAIKQTKCPKSKEKRERKMPEWEKRKVMQVRETNQLKFQLMTRLKVLQKEIAMSSFPMQATGRAMPMSSFLEAEAQAAVQTEKLSSWSKTTAVRMIMTHPRKLRKPTKLKLRPRSNNHKSKKPLRSILAAEALVAVQTEKLSSWSKTTVVKMIRMRLRLPGKSKNKGWNKKPRKLTKLRRPLSSSHKSKKPLLKKLIWFLTGRLSQRLMSQSSTVQRRLRK